MDRPVRIAFIGCGSVMSGPYSTLARRLRERGEVELVWACDVDPDRAARAGTALGIERTGTDYREVIEADDVDAVLVLTSMAEHGPITRAALEAGKHVLVEKPMATTLAEAQQLLSLARQSPGRLVCAPHVVLSPTYQAIWRHLQRGDIGPVHLARARYGWSGPWWGQWFYRSGGGPLFDLGVYNLTTLTGLLGPAQRVTAMAGTAIGEREVDGELIKVEVEDNFQITVDFGEARFGTVTTGFSMQAYRGPAVELYGGAGTIQLMGDDWAPAGYELWRNDHGAWEIHRDADPHWPWTDGLRHLVDCIRTGAEPVIRPEHAYHVLEIMIKAIDSAREGRTLRIDSTFEPPTFARPDDDTAAHLRHDPSR